jgi:general secretion pathway protein H
MTRRLPVARRQHSGFTLLELLVVLVLAAITVAVVGGGAQSFMDRARYHQTVRDIGSLLVQARTISLRDGRPVVVTYDSATRQLIGDGQLRIVLPAQLEVRWDAIERRSDTETVQGDPLFIFNTEGGAQGGELSVMRGGQGVAFGVNWLLGSIKQTAVRAPS